MKHFLLILLILFSFSVKAQVQLSLSLERNLYIVYEPLVVRVALTNLSGRDLTLKSEGSHRWFDFDIQAADGRLIASRNVDDSPVILKAGATILHSVNITPRFLLDNFGTYRISAIVFLADLNRYFRSSVSQFEITEGRLIRQQEVGILNSTDTRLISFLVHPLPQSTAFYLRIEDRTKGIIYCTHQLGDIVAYSQPEVEIDDAHSVHVLQSYAPRKFIYTIVGLDGKILARKFYLETIGRPFLKRDDDGHVIVQGGTLSYCVQKR